MYPELEIFLYRHGEVEFTGSFRFRSPNDQKDVRFEADVIHIDTEEFKSSQLLADPVRYGWKLGQALFTHPAAREAIEKALDSVDQKDNTRLRIRFCTDQRSLALHRLRWETLRLPKQTAPDDPELADWLLVNQNVIFSRHLFSGDMRPIRLRPQSALTALIAIANPTNIDNYQSDGRPFAPIQVDDELATAEQGLGLLAKSRLIADGTPGGATGHARSSPGSPARRAGCAVPSLPRRLSRWRA